MLWSGLPLSPVEALHRYDVDKVLTTHELNPTLASFAKDQTETTVFAISGQVSRKDALRPFARADFSALRAAIDEARVVKDAYEVALIRAANGVSALAHNAVQDQARSAIVSNERELLGTFVGTCIAYGADTQAYPPIVASGLNAATLHYVKNDSSLHNKLNVLLDAGAEYRYYASDVTRTFPASGPSFTIESRNIYDIVQEMQESCFAMLRAGVLWQDVHMNAHRVVIRGLKRLGLLKGDETELMDKRVSVAFFPHGLGHHLGLDTHDVGGNANRDDPDVMFRYLRLRGDLPKDCVVTVEPGVCNHPFLS